MVRVRSRQHPRGLVGTPMSKEPKGGHHGGRRRRPIKPLPMPAFGQPAFARQCAACGHWYPWTHFNRPGGRVERCVGCIQSKRKPAKQS